MKSVLLLSVCFLFSINVSSGIVCETENIFGSTSYVTCPRSYDDPNEIFCCGSKYSVDCCSNPLGLEQEDFEKLADNSIRNLLVKRSTVGSLRSAVNETETKKVFAPKEVEGFWENLKIAKNKIKIKINSTIDYIKQKTKKKLKGKVKKVIENSIDPSGRTNLRRFLKKRSTDGNAQMVNEAATKTKLKSNEGIQDKVKLAKDKVKMKLNGTIENTKQKAKKKMKDKVQKKIEKTLDPSGHMKLPAILGTLFAIAIGLVILCVVCCCCCPFCLLHKKRSRGAVHQPTAVTQMQPPSNYAPVQQPHQYPNTSYPPQQPGYAPPHQPQGYGMPPQAAGAPYPTSQPQYPASQPPYPTSPSAGNEQPPPYTEKQLPFNPNY